MEGKGKVEIRNLQFYLVFIFDKRNIKILEDSNPSKIKKISTPQIGISPNVLYFFLTHFMNLFFLLLNDNNTLI